MSGRPLIGIGFSCMEHNVQAYLYDIVTACRHITSFTAEMTLEAYSSDIRTKAACERMFDRDIGEPKPTHAALWWEYLSSPPSRSRHSIGKFTSGFPWADGNRMILPLP